MMSRLQGKIVFITGASAGIGKACATEFARAGSNLILTARRVERLEQIKKELLEQYKNIQVYTAPLDVNDKNQIKDVVANLPATFKDVDVLVNNAGMVRGVDPLETVKEEDLDLMFSTNVKGLVLLTQAILPRMKERETGHIINLGSIASTEAYAGGSIYCATKHAVNAITNALRIELVDTPIRVSQIRPGMVNTEFSTVRFYGDKSKADKVYEGLQPLLAEDIAETVVFTANRPPHVDIADMLVFPTCQAASKIVSRKA
ncbi:unnamed protein product [Cunninghamella echinulata]